VATSSEASDVLDFLTSAATLTVMAFIVGYSCPKTIIWGSLATGVLWGVYFLLPELRPQHVLDMMVPRLLSVFNLYPMFFSDMLGSGASADGLIGMVIYGGVAIYAVIPFLIGVVAGLLTWPELFLVRVIL
jgi:hypothetical protein